MPAPVSARLERLALKAEDGFDLDYPGEAFAFRRDVLKCVARKDWKADDRPNVISALAQGVKKEDDDIIQFATSVLASAYLAMGLDPETAFG